MSNKLFLLPALLGAMLLLTPACDKDDCKDVDCGANGTCFEGVCDCDPGYEVGTSGACDTEVRDKLIGTFTTTEQCSTDPNPQPYNITITRGTGDISEIQIFNFYNSFATTPVRATVDGDQVTIATQTPATGGVIQVQGSGTISTNASGKTVLTLTYTATNTSNNTSATCTNTVFTKQ